MITLSGLAMHMHPWKGPSTGLTVPLPRRTPVGRLHTWYVTEAARGSVLELTGWRDGFVLLDGQVWPRDDNDRPGRPSLRHERGPIVNVLLPLLFAPLLFVTSSPASRPAPLVSLPEADRARLDRLPIVVDVMLGLFAAPWLHLTARLLSTAHTARRLSTMASRPAWSDPAPMSAVSVTPSLLVDALLDDADLRGALLAMARMKVPLLELLATVESRILNGG